MKRTRRTRSLRIRSNLHLTRLESLEDRRLLASILVNTTADTTTPGATLSLRQAIEVSNGTLAVSSLSTQEQALVTGAVGASNTIGFDIPTTDPGYDPADEIWTISVHSALPAISTNAAIINGYSQPGSSENTLTQADNATLAIAVDGSGQGTIDGLTIGTTGSQVFGLDIEDFSGSGVVITAPGGAQVAGCFIGTDATGDLAAPNGYGVSVENSFNTVGGSLVGNRNIISGNAAPDEGDGIFIPEQSLNPTLITVTGTQVENNFIGLDADGDKAVPNSQSGIADFGTGNTFGGAAAGVGNVISGNASEAIKSSGSITIEGNFIGTDPTGTIAIGNGTGADGIAADQFPGNLTNVTTITNNLISGNQGVGVAVSVGDQATSTYTISNNRIGTNAAGTAALGNGSAGLQLESIENATVDNNLISGNKTFGLAYSGFGLDLEKNVFQGNKIGTDITGLLPIGNTDAGISFSTAIGNLFAGNVVAFNGGDAIDLTSTFGDASTNDEFTQNSIFENSGAGIKLGSGGTNQFVMPPTLTFTPLSGGGGTLAGSIVNGVANQHYLIEFFSNPTAPAAGHEQGETFVQNVVVVTNGSGVGTFSVPVPTAIYTATTTEEFANSPGNTSQFSLPVGSAALPASTTTLTSSSNPSTLGQLVTFTAVVAAPGFAGTPTGNVTFSIDGKAETPVALTVVGGVDEAKFATTSLSVGAHTVSAAYGGNANVAPSNGSLPTQTVDAPGLLSTTTVLASSINPSTDGQSVTFTAIVAAPGFQGAPSGSVIFAIDGNAEAPEALSVVGGVDKALFTTSALTAGPHTVTANYSGDASLNPSSGSLPIQTVMAASPQPSTTRIGSSMNPSTVGQSVTFIAVVSAPESLTPPTGTVTFTIDGKAETPVPLSLVGERDEAPFTTSTLSVGTHTVSASYSGDASVNSSGNSLQQTVDAAKLLPTTTVLGSSANPSTVGESVTFTAVVVGDNSKVLPTGSVTFTIDGQTQAPAPLTLLAGVEAAQLSTSSLSIGAHAISASYSGNSVFTASSASLPTQTINAAPPVATTTVLTSATNPTVFGQQAVFTATVTSADGSSTGGTVAFVEGTTVIGSEPLGIDDKATFEDSSLPVGPSTLRAVYIGDPSHSQSISNPIMQVIEDPSIAIAPTVVVVQRFGYHKQPTSLVLTFSSALDVSSATDMSNYQIVTLGGPGRGGKLVGHSTAIEAATYNPSTFAVTLVPTGRLDFHNRYLLTVNGTSQTGVRGASGALLDGDNNGEPGSNFTASITRQILVGPAPGFSKLPRQSALTQSKHAGAPLASGVDLLSAPGGLRNTARRDLHSHRSSS